MVEKVKLGDGSVVEVKGMGIVRVQGKVPLIISKVHLVPELNKRLLSIQFTSLGAKITFVGKTCVIKRGGVVLATGNKDQRLDNGIVKMNMHQPCWRYELVI